jgi:ketosteroid isomerase-like protein
MRDESDDVSTEDETRSVVQQFYDCLLRADLDGVSRLLHPDVLVREAPSSPHGGAHIGRTEALKLLALMIFQIIADTVMVGDVLVGASPAAAFLEIPFTPGNPTLLHARLPVVEKFVIRDSLITEITPYYCDTAAVVT